MARITLRLPNSLHEQLRDEAAHQGVSLNTALVAAAARWVTGAQVSSWLKSQRDSQAIDTARTVLAQYAQAGPSRGDRASEAEIGQQAADIVRAHRRKSRKTP